MDGPLDEDELLNDYMEVEEPMDEDLDYLQAMMDDVVDGNTGSTTGSNSTNGGTVAATTTATTNASTGSGTNNTLAPTATSTTTTTEATTTTTSSATTTNTNETEINSVLYHRKTEDQLFHFDRYNKKTSEWREAAKQDATISHATRWKKEESPASAASTILLGRYKKSVAPETQLLQFLQHRHENHTSTKWKLTKCRRLPQSGHSSIAMTVADGSRVHIRCNSKEKDKDVSAPKTKYSTSSTCSLGVSMAELKRRCQRIQRAQLHQQQQEQSLSSTSTEATTGKNSNDSSLLWVDKHAPQSFPQLLSDERTNRDVLRALRAWDPYVFGKKAPPPPPSFFSNPSASTDAAASSFENKDALNTNTHDKRPLINERVLLLSGNPGVGKTTLAHIIARHAGYRPVEVNGSDERSASVLTDRVRRAMESTTLNLQSSKDSGRPNCLILDEIDGADAKGAVQALVEIIKADLPAKTGKSSAVTNKKTKKRHHSAYLRRPIIFICNHKYATALRPLLPYAKHFTVEAPSSTRLVGRLNAVLSVEGLSMMAGGSVLNQLITTSGGDIRSCLYTLQFAAARAKTSQDMFAALTESLSGMGLKDNRNDMASTITTVFRKFKKKGLGSSTTTRISDGKRNPSSALEDKISGVNKVFDAVEGFGDHSTTINSLFTNLNRVSYIDPTLDRCTAAHEWISGADAFLSQHVSGQDQIGASIGAAIHLLCRVELKPKLVFSTREMSDARFQRDANVGLVQRFCEGLPAKARSIKTASLLPTEIIPLLLWILSVGEGKSPLCRAASSIEVLSNCDRSSVDRHVATLLATGLTYVKETEPENSASSFQNKSSFGNNQPRQDSSTGLVMKLDPPIDRLVQYPFFHLPQGQRRRAIPSAMKGLLAHQVRMETLRGGDSLSSADNQKKNSNKNSGASTSSPEPPTRSSIPLAAKVTPDTVTPRKLSDLTSAIRSPPPKRLKVGANEDAKKGADFLGLGARKAKAAKSARKAAALGLNSLNKTKQTITTHTGSGLLLNQSIRLKYVKGFTQAVRTPCRLEDLE